jgi:hypothetical protein
MQRGLVPHIIVVPAALPGAVVGRTPTILPNDWFYIRISNFFAISNFSCCQRLTPVAGLFLWDPGFEKIFKTQGIFKIRRSALLATTCSK